MKHPILPLLLAALPLLAACTHTTDTLPLVGWQLHYNNSTIPATVPGFVHNDLMATGIIPDPYFAANEDSVRWVSNRQWTYTVSLDRASLPKGDTLWVVFEGLAGPADILFCDNVSQPDTIVSYSSDNMFVSHIWPLPDFASGIIVRFHPLDDSTRQAAYGITLPDRRAFTRVAPYQQGWDWGPNIPTFGIWKSVYITNNHPDNPTTTSTSTTPTSPTSPITLVQAPDSIGQSFTFCRDGKPIFVKGANWIPVHSFPVLDSANRARYRHLLCSAREAGFNMLRVWGGGIYEHDYFFQLCDSLGLMVWMDFNFSTMLYPDNPAMLSSIRLEAVQNIRRIATHPCVVLWCGNNEVKNGWEDWGWQDLYHWSPSQRARLQHSIDTIFGPDGILAQAVRDNDPLHRPYISTSPLYGWGHPECVTHGDSHYWGVWWGEEPFERYAEKTGRLMSEYGFQSYPMLTTLRRVIPADELHIGSPSMNNHQKHARGREIIDKAMQHYYGFDSRTLSLDDYCYVSQLLQAWGTGYGILQHISRQPHCMGTLYWQLNDCWPVASWSSIDYYGNWKALHYRAQALYNAEHDTASLRHWQHYYSVYPKNRSYPAPHFTVSSTVHNSHLETTINAETDLYDVYLDTDPHIDGHFTRNFFDLPAGHSLTLTFLPVDPNADISAAKVTVRTLNALYQNHP